MIHCQTVAAWVWMGARTMVACDECGVAGADEGDVEELIRLAAGGPPVTGLRRR